MKWAKEKAEAGIEIFSRRTSEAEKELSKCFEYLKSSMTDLEKLEKEYPGKEV